MNAKLSTAPQGSKIRSAAKHTGSLFAQMLPILVGVLALVSLLIAAIPAESIAAWIPAEGLMGTLAGVLLGGLFAGNPVTSYVLAGEFMTAGVSVTIATAFIVSWVTLGVLHIATEVAVLGLRFTLWRTTLCVVFAVVIAEAIGLSMRHV
jgi:uncharacterized membrane protein YraQ (UPF0718 family)